MVSACLGLAGIACGGVSGPPEFGLGDPEHEHHTGGGTGLPEDDVPDPDPQPDAGVPELPPDADGCRPNSVFTARRWVDAQTPEELAALDGYQRIEATVHVRGGAITDLGPLRCAEEITGDLVIQGAGDLISLRGLDRLETVGQRLGIDGSPALGDLSGLGALRRVGSLWLRDLRDLAGLPPVLELTTSEPHFSEVWVSGVAEATTLRGLPRLWVGPEVDDRLLEVRIASNPRLRDLDGLDVDANSGWALVVRDNPALESLGGMGGMTRVGQLRIEGNPSLQTLAGLEELREVGDELVVLDNDGLEGLSGLNGLRWAHTIQVAGNDRLSTLRGLESLEVLDSLVLGAGCFLRRGADGSTDNPGLTNLDGLTGVTSLEHLFVEEQSGLLGLEGLLRLTKLGSGSLFNNPSLDPAVAEAFLLDFGLNPQMSACGNGPEPACGYECPEHD